MANDATAGVTRVAVIGGRGRIGGFFARVFERAGCDVVVADGETELTPADAAAGADAVLVSVPIGVTEAVVREVGPAVREGGVLMDVTSLKSEPVAWMTGASRCEVVGMHPMFGPGVASLEGQVVVVCPGRGERWRAWLRGVLEGQGAAVVETGAEAHDRVMAVVQVLRHVATMAMGGTLASLGVDVSESLRFASPIYRLELMMTGRLFAQDPGLYAEIAMRNPYREEVLGAYERVVRESVAAVVAGDRAAFDGGFAAARAYFGGFTEEAMAESSRLIRAMVEAGGGQSPG